MIKNKKNKKNKKKKKGGSSRGVLFRVQVRTHLIFERKMTSIQILGYDKDSSMMSLNVFCILCAA